MNQLLTKFTWDNTESASCTLFIPGGGYSQKNWVGVCGPLPKILTQLMTKICDIPYPIYDQTKNMIWLLNQNPVQINVKLPQT